MTSSQLCDRCGGTGKTTYRTLGDLEPTDMGNGTTIQDMGGSGTRACECVRDLPAIDGEAKWWETESIYSDVVAVPIGNECIELSADCEVPRDEHGRRVHRAGNNVYYPCLVRLDFPSPGVTFHPEDARKLAESLIAAADACDTRDKPAFGSIQR